MLGHEVTEAIITVPAYFSDAQRKLALKDEGQFAMQEAFRKLGQQAGSEIFINKDVTKGMC